LFGVSRIILKIFPWVHTCSCSPTHCSRSHFNEITTLKGDKLLWIFLFHITKHLTIYFIVLICPWLNFG
jgi:hypothetical protein